MLEIRTKIPYRFTTFNAQGAYLIAILARTEKSKALRRWLAKFMAKDLHRLKDRHEADQTRIKELETKLQALPEPGAERKALAKIRRLERRGAALRNERDAVGGAAKCVVQACHDDLDHLRAQLNRG